MKLDPAVIAAIIGAFGAVAAAVVTVILAERAKRRANAALTQKQDELKHAQTMLHSLLEEKYGLYCESARVVVELRDGGDVAIHTYVKGLQAHGGHEFDALPLTNYSSAPAAKVDAKPKIKENGKKAMLIEPRSLSDKRSEFLVRIPAKLTGDDAPIDYELEILNQKSWLALASEVAEYYGKDPYPYEFHSADVAFPTKQLDLEVFFPAGYNASAFHAVWYGSTQLLHHSEFKRSAFEKDDQASRKRAKLTVERPLPGFRYVIYWKAPDA
jgi:hypothetical protein